MYHCDRARRVNYWASENQTMGAQPCVSPEAGCAQSNLLVSPEVEKTRSSFEPLAKKRRFNGCDPEGFYIEMAGCCW